MTWKMNILADVPVWLTNQQTNQTKRHGKMKIMADVPKWWTDQQTNQTERHGKMKIMADVPVYGGPINKLIRPNDMVK